MTAVLLALTAIIAYMMGSLNTTIIASHFVFHCDLFQYSRDNVGITRFLNRFGKKGAFILVGIEVLKTLIPVLLGGLILVKTLLIPHMLKKSIYLHELSYII